MRFVVPFSCKKGLPPKIDANPMKIDATPTTSRTTIVDATWNNGNTTTLAYVPTPCGRISFYKLYFYFV